MSYVSEVLADNPIGYWRLGETSGTVANDETANNLDGTYVNAPTLGVAGAVAGGNTAVTLNGADEYAQVPHNTLLNVGDVFTLEAWIKRGETSSTALQTVFSKRTSGLMFILQNHQVQIARYGSSNTPVVRSNVTIQDTNWHHIVGTKSGSTLKIYIDGVDRTGTIANQQIFNTTFDLYIGQNGVGSGFFNGSLDEVAIYSTALSQTRVVAHYNAAFNSAPYVPSGLTPSGNTGSASGILSASVSDPDGDTIASVTIELYDETAVAYVTGYSDVSPQVVTTGLADGVMEHDATAALVVGHSYRFRAKASDGSLTSAFSAWSYFTYGVAPVVTLTSPTSGSTYATPGAPITFTYSHPSALAKIADRVVIEKLVGASYVASYDSGWVGTEGSPEPRTSIPLTSGTLRNQESYRIKVFARASGGFEGDTGFVAFSVAYTGPATLTPTATPDTTRAEVLVDWPTSALTTDFGGYEVAVGDPTGTVATANKTIVAYISDKATSQYTYPFPVSGESKGYYVRQLQVIGPDLVEGNWARVTATCGFGDRIFVKSVADPYNLLFDFEPLRRNLPSQTKGASQQFLRTWGRISPVELLGEGREVAGRLEIPFYDSALFAQSAAARFAILESIEALRGTIALLLSLPTKRKEFAAIEGDVDMGLDDLLKPAASLNWRRVDHSEDYYDN